MDRNLFAQFAGQWTAIDLARDIPRDRPLARIVAGERVVLFRDRDGRVRALIDRCPHRGVALSLGTLQDGELACPFHGWRFNGEGDCTHVPWNPDAKRAQLGATPLPVREAGGLIWLHTAPCANDGPNVPAILAQPSLRCTVQHFTWDVHWTRVMENMLDTPHLPFVHAATIGRGLKGRTTQRMDMEWRETDTGAQIIATREGEAARTSLVYHFPNIMELKIDPPGRTFRMLAVCTPEAPGRTRLSLYTLRSFARLGVLDPLFAWVNAKIAREDKAIIESSLPREVPPPHEERSVASDAPTLAFRKIWHTRIQPGPSRPAQENTL